MNSTEADGETTPKPRKRRPILRWVGRLIGGLVLGIALYLGWVGYGFVSSKPQIAGAQRVEGLTGEARIVRDAHGVPHIFASNARDVYFALGYAHAQDRFFQMDVTRRSTEGRVAELVGKLGLRLDARARIQGFDQIIETQTKALTPQLREMLEAYADGVNARLKQGAPSPEYAILLVKPAPWRIEDSIAAGLAMVDNLTLGTGDEIARAALAEKLSPEQIAQFLPRYPSWAPRSIDAADLTALGGGGSSKGAGTTDRVTPGSNAWVLSGAHTKSGKPLLANDPHLDFSAPAPFYLVHLRLPERNLVGATLPGAPIIVVGHNDKIAWTNTTNEIDSADIIRAPKDGFKDVRTRMETIKVRDWFWISHQQTIKVQSVEHGPLLDPDYFNLKAFKGQPVMLRSAALDPNNRIFEATRLMSSADSVDEFIAGSEGWTAPMTHELVASVDGDIGLVSTGWLPLRDQSGTWTGYVPWTAQPNIKNPKSGIIATANNLATPDAYPYPMPGDFATYRIARIRALLDGAKDFDAARMGAMQMDTNSVFAARVLPALLTAAPKTKDGQAALAKLKTWNGAYDADRAEPLIFAAWIDALARALYGDEIGDELFKDYDGPRENFLDTVFTGPASSWCDQRGTPAKETCAEIAGPALDRTVANLAKTYGADQSRWTWGAVHQANFVHPLFGGAPLIGGLFNVRQPIGGNATTILAGAYKGGDFTDRHGASFRAVYDLSDLNASRFMIAPGNSGHPLSPHYKDLVSDWAAGRGFEIRTDIDPKKPPSGSSVLVLTPNTSGS